MDENLPIINTLWNYSDPAATREKFLSLTNEIEGKASLNYHLELKTQIARTYSLQAKFSDAHQILDDVETKLTDETKVANIRYLLERGRTFNSAKEKEKAKKLFINAYEQAKRIDSFSYAIDAAHMVAIATESLDDKVAWNTKGMEEAERGDEKVKGWVGVFLNNMGWDLFDAKRFDEALVMFEQCSTFHKERNSQDKLGIARWSYAKTLRMLGKTTESLEIQKSLLEKKNNQDDSGYISEELGELYLLKGEDKLSQEYFAKAYELLSKDTWLVRNEKARLDRIKNLAHIK